MNDVDVLHTAIKKLWKHYSRMTYKYRQHNFLKVLRTLTEAVEEAEFCSSDEFTLGYRPEINLAHKLVQAL
jgi:hypothetical protein